MIIHFEKGRPGGKEIISSSRGEPLESDVYYDRYLFKGFGTLTVHVNSDLIRK
ncbi:MAG: hypothetical protein WD035_08160 [Balneolaceae bacterium]